MEQTTQHPGLRSQAAVVSAPILLDSIADRINPQDSHWLLHRASLARDPSLQLALLKGSEHVTRGMGDPGLAEVVAALAMPAMLLLPRPTLPQLRDHRNGRRGKQGHGSTKFP